MKALYMFLLQHMSSEDEAKTAIEGLNNSDFGGSKISVEVCKICFKTYLVII